MRKPRLYRSIVSACFFIIFAATAETVVQYRFQLWQTDDGLPHNSIQAAVQTRDGCFWLGTPKGLVRFDGVRFSIFKHEEIPGAGGLSISALCEGRDGSLWVGSNENGLLLWQNEKLSLFTEENGLPCNAVRCLMESRDGTLWVGTTNGLARFAQGKWSTFSIKDGLASNTIRALCEGRDGTIWISSHVSLYHYREGQITLAEVSRQLAFGSIKSLCEDRNGDLWIGANYGLIRIGRDGIARRFTASEGLSGRMVSALCQDRQGQLWIGTFGGLNRFNKERLLARETLPHRVIHCVLEDREGNIWIGAKDGLSRLTVRPFVSYTAEHGLTQEITTSVCEDRDGTIWIGTWGDGLKRWQSGKITDYSFSKQPSAPVLVLALRESRAGGLWIGTDFDGGLFHLKDGVLTRYTKEHGLNESAVRVVYEDENGNVWLGTSTALVRFADGKFSRYTKENGLAGNTVRIIHQDTTGSLWLGTESGLSRWKDGKFTNFTTREGLPHNTVIALHEDVDGHLWIGTAGGVCRMKSIVSAGENQKNGQQENEPPPLTFHIDCFTTKDGLFNDQIHEILEDDRGCLWMSSPNGISRVSKQSLEDFANGKTNRINSMSFGRHEGLASSECSSVAKPGGWKSRDGRLWFATARGVSVVDPSSNLQRNELPPPVVIEEVMADRKKVERGNRAGPTTRRFNNLTIPPGRGELEFHYTALSFTAPEKNQFRYKLEGFDSDWVDAGTRRFAYYSNLRPGSYTFRVIASNNDGVWNSLGSSVKLGLQPHFWQTWWFYGLVMVGAGAGIGTTSRYITGHRMKRQMERLEQQHALERERHRIAQDMHDDLGANLTQIALLSELTKSKAAEPQEVISHAEKISQTARELVDAMDEIVWAVNPKNDNLPEFAGYLFQRAEEFFSLTEIRFRREKPVSLPPLPLTAEVRHSLFLVVKEALHNVVKHAGATEARLKLALKASELSIVVEDNGCGFEMNSTRPFSNGLKNMRQRMEELGGRFEIASRPSAGTQITVRVRT